MSSNAETAWLFNGPWILDRNDNHTSLLAQSTPKDLRACLQACEDDPRCNLATWGLTQVPATSAEWARREESNVTTDKLLLPDTPAPPTGVCFTHRLTSIHTPARVPDEQAMPAFTTNRPVLASFSRQPAVGQAPYLVAEGILSAALPCATPRTAACGWEGGDALFAPTCTRFQGLSDAYTTCLASCESTSGCVGFSVDADNQLCALVFEKSTPNGVLIERMENAGTRAKVPYSSIGPRCADRQYISFVRATPNKDNPSTFSAFIGGRTVHVASAPYAATRRQSTLRAWAASAAVLGVVLLAVVVALWLWRLDVHTDLGLRDDVLR
jgi:hypothetical protein